MGEANTVSPVALTTSPPASVTTESTSMRSAPSASPPLTSTGSRTGRNLRQKVVDELKNVRVRKSPASKDKRGASAAAPPPLELNEDVDDEEDDVVQDPQTGKAKGCSICERSFTVFRAKHTCKMCAQKICDDCSKNRMKLHRRLERKKGSRLCDPCARNYIHSENCSGEGDDSFPDASPALTSLHSEYTLTNKHEDNGLSRRHSVPAKTLSSLIHAKGKDPNSTVNGVSPTKQISTNAGISKMRASACAQVKKVAHPSHLRTRHWMSLLAVAVLVTLRVIYYNRRNGVEGSALTPDTAGSSLSPPYSFLERAVNNLLSMRTLGTYFLGLVLFDELSRPKGKDKPVKKQKQRRRRRRRVSTSSGEQPRERTKSSLSDSSVASKRRAVESSGPPSPHTSQEDELEVAVNEQNHEEEGFTLDKLVSALEEGAKARAPDGDLSLVCFMATCNVICGFLGVFGRATSFAGSTVGAYFTSIDHNLEAWPAPSSSNTWKEQSVKAVIEHEVELGVADVGGKKKPSCSRCLLRLLWFIQFVEACVRLTLLESTEENCYAGASKAYEETLGKRHPWLVRKGVNTALGSIPTRSHILGELHVGDGDPLEFLSKAHTELVRVIAELKAVFEEHGLTDLK
ncbi:hypothetical protein DVH05_004732 [Phytophthora capsici]|nr:hypothetical protein DVH05_004732 [Phytophthora capsici]